MAKRVRLFADGWSEEGVLFDADHAKRILKDSKGKITDKPRNANQGGNTTEDRDEEE